MLSISLPGLIGAIVGTCVAGVTYHLFIGALERSMLEREPVRTAEDRERMEIKLSVVRRTVLIADWLVFAGIGYWIADTVWG